ncbi:MAG TPA: hypothetical protein VE078_18290 [Thermoanaerobaculia bacterium]|nr:hypothetical protein [Thermoanaerobaculia bacterium]
MEDDEEPSPHRSTRLCSGGPAHNQLTSGHSALEAKRGGTGAGAGISADIDPSTCLREAGLTTRASIDNHLTLNEPRPQAVGLVELAHKADSSLRLAGQLKEIAEARVAIPLQVHRPVGQLSR